jgi:hypothetical protein
MRQRFAKLTTIVEAKTAKQIERDKRWRQLTGRSDQDDR